MSELTKKDKAKAMRNGQMKMAKENGLVEMLTLQRW